MQLKLIEKNDKARQYHFLVKGVDVPFLNAIRRSVVSLTPTMAIEDIEFRQNSSVLYDEFLAHRIGLVPLTTDLKSYDMIESEEDKESLKCINKLTLDVKGPKTVYSGDLKSADKGIKPVHDTIPLVKLKKGQEVRLEATAILGLGKQHMKFSPGLIFYKNKPFVTVGKTVDVETLKRRIPADSAVTIDGNKVKVDDDKLYTTNYFDAFVNESVVEGLDVSMAEDEFVLYIESFGQLEAKDMMSASVDALKSRLSDLASQINKA